MKKYILFTISFIIVALILSFGQAAYHKQITNLSNTDNDATTATAVDGVTITPTDNLQTEGPKNEEQRNERTEEPNSLEANNTQTAEAGSTNVITTQIQPSSTPASTTKPNAEPTNNTPVKTVQLKIQGLDSYKIDLTENDNGWDIMRKAADKYAFLLVYKNYGWGMWVKQIGKLAEHDNYYWALYYNNGYSQVGITDLKPQANDIIEWKMETW